MKTSSTEKSTVPHNAETPSTRLAGEAAPKRKRVAGIAKFANAAAGTTGERIAKAMARAGLCSRREAETWIADGRVQLNGKVLDTPAVTVSGRDRILVDGQPLPLKERTRLFLYHKPRGLVTTTSDPEGRPTVFERLPDDLPRLISVGRLDINTEGLLLLTNDGGLARVLELPSTGWLRRYRVRAFGEVTKEQLDSLKEGVTIEGISYGPVEAEIDTVTGSNVWMLVGLREGKNREVKRILQHLGLTVNRLIRISFGPFQLGDLDDGEVREIRGKVLRDQLGARLVDEAGADFDAPIIHHINGSDADTGKPSRQQKAAPQKSSGDAPRKRTSRTHMEFLGTGEDGSREARLNRDGKPSVAVKYAPRARAETPAPRARGPRPDKGEVRSFRPRSDRPERGPGPERAQGDRPSRDPRPQRPDGDRPARGPRPDRSADATRGDRSFRSAGFKERGTVSSGRGPAPDRGERPNRSEGLRDRPTGGLSHGPKRDAAGRPDRNGVEGPRNPGGPKGPRAGGPGGKGGPSGKGGAGGKGGQRTAGPRTGGTGADRRR